MRFIEKIKNIFKKNDRVISLNQNFSFNPTINNIVISLTYPKVYIFKKTYIDGIEYHAILMPGIFDKSYSPAAYQCALQVKHFIPRYCLNKLPDIQEAQIVHKLKENLITQLISRASVVVRQENMLEYFMRVSQGKE